MGSEASRTDINENNEIVTVSEGDEKIGFADLPIEVRLHLLKQCFEMDVDVRTLRLCSKCINDCIENFLGLPLEIVVNMDAPRTDIEGDLPSQNFFSLVFGLHIPSVPVQEYLANALEEKFKSKCLLNLIERCRSRLNVKLKSSDDFFLRPHILVLINSTMRGFLSPYLPFLCGLTCIYSSDQLKSLKLALNSSNKPYLYMSGRCWDGLERQFCFPSVEEIEINVTCNPDNFYIYKTVISSLVLGTNRNKLKSINLSINSSRTIEDDIECSKWPEWLRTSTSGRKGRLSPSKEQLAETWISNQMKKMYNHCGEGLLNLTIKESVLNVDAEYLENTSWVYFLNKGQFRMLNSFKLAGIFVRRLSDLGMIFNPNLKCVIFEGSKHHQDEFDDSYHHNLDICPNFRLEVFDHPGNNLSIIYRFKIARLNSEEIHFFTF